MRFFIVFFLLLFHTNETTSYSCQEIVEKMLKSIDDAKTLSFNFKQMARINGSIKKSEINARLQVSPRKIFIHIMQPKHNVKILYNSEKGSKVTVKPNSFPFIPIELDPLSNILRDDNHHTIFELGYTFTGEILKEAFKNAGNDFNKYFECKGIVDFEGKSCYAVVINYDDFKFIDYTVKAGENLRSIAQSKKLSEYMILENNPKLKDYNDVKAGQVIKIPTGYAKKTILYIDKELFLPVMMSMFDDKGLYERFEYRDLKVNPKFPESEFLKTNKEYGM
jgi:outer membrane lipoprotein-sorting protein